MGEALQETPGRRCKPLAASSAADGAASGRIFHVPYARNRAFTGREAILSALDEALKAHRATALTQAIAGLGGIGKTQTAVEYCYRHRDDYRAVLWARADS